MTFLPATTRSAILARMMTAIPYRSRAYNQATLGPTGYRDDCSGMVSCWLGVGRTDDGNWGGASTVTLLTRGYVKPIRWGDLLPGDVIGLLGEGSAGDDGHVVMFLRYARPGLADMVIREQSGGDSGPHERVLSFTECMDAGYLPYRYNNIIEEVDTEMDSTQAKELADVAYTTTHISYKGSQVALHAYLPAVFADIAAQINGLQQAIATLTAHLSTLTPKV